MGVLVLVNGGIGRRVNVYRSSSDNGVNGSEGTLNAASEIASAFALKIVTIYRINS